MEWWLALLILLGSMVGLMLLGLPVAFVFLLMTVVGAVIYWGGESGIELFILNIRSSVSSFELLPIPMFVLLGIAMSESGMATRMLDVLDKWMGSLPGRLSLLAVAWATLFSTMTGSAVATTAMLGSTLVPEMEKRGYSKSMSLGPIMGSGGLAMIIPPSSMAVLIAAIGKMSTARLLISGVVPGLILAALYAGYVILRCRLQPSVAPSYKVPPTPLGEKLQATVRYVLPLGLIVVVVLGFMILGLSTPTEAAALGALASFCLAACYGKLNWGMFKKSVMGTLSITVMVLIIITGAKTLSQIFVFSGVSTGMTKFALSWTVAPIVTIIIMQVVIMVLGTFMSYVGIMMVTLPIFMPIVTSLGYDPVWFGLLFLINIDMAHLTPPYGILLFVMKAVAPLGTTLGDVIRASVPFLLCDIAAMGLIMVFPPLALWLPGVMH